MKRRDLIPHLEAHGCEWLREGGNHTVYVNRAAQKTSAVPRHHEINDFLIYGSTLAGLMVYSKGKFVRENGEEVYYFLVSSKRAI
jgi:mRNA interferase HicA